MELKIYESVSGLIFDLAGTLLHSMPIHYEAWKEVFSELGPDLSIGMSLKTAGMPTGKIFGIIKSEYNPGFDVENLDIKKENTYAKRMHKLKVIDEVVNVVYQNNGKRAMSVGAGSPRKNARESLKLKGLDEYIKILVSKDDVQQHKPHPEIFLKCAELMGADPGNCHVFEYGDLGIQTAKSRGMHVTDSRKHLNQTI